MGSLTDDLDRFLKTDGMRIIFAADSMGTKPCMPLAENDIGSLSRINLEELEEEDLENLLEEAEDLRKNLEDRLSRVEIFMDSVQDRLDELEE